LVVWELAFVAFSGLFFQLLTPSTLGAFNFFNYIPLLMSFNALEAPIRGVQILFGHWKQWNLVFGFILLWMFKCSIIDRFTL
jgi:hypothetical protein